MPRCVLIRRLVTFVATLSSSRANGTEGRGASAPLLFCLGCKQQAASSKTPEAKRQRKQHQATPGQTEGADPQHC